MFTIAKNNTCNQSKSRVISNLSQKYMKTKTKKTAWVIKNRKTGKFLNRLAKSETTAKLENALLFPTRKDAREERYADKETVQQVKIDKSFRAIRVIGGNGPNCLW